VSRRFAHEVKAGEVVCLALGLLILLWAGGVITEKVKVTKGSTCLGHHLLKLLLLVLKAVLLLALALVAGVVPVIVVVLVEWGVELLPIGIVGDEVGGIAALKEAPRWAPPLFAKLVQGSELPRQ
jgi:hypothetical protein